MTLSLTQSVTSVFGALVLSGMVAAAGLDGWKSHESGRNRFGETASQLSEACLQPGSTLAIRASKAVLCPLSGGAQIATALTGPFAGTRGPAVRP